MSSQRLLLLTSALLGLWQGGGTGSEAPPREATEAGATAEEIVTRLIQENAHRDQLLAGFVVSRRYQLKNELTNKEATMEVDVSFRAPAELSFDIRSQQGSGFLARRVFGRMMEGERESLEPEAKRRSAVTPENYQITLAGEETVFGRRVFVLEITPRREDTFLFTGRVWIDAQEFAVVQAEGTVPKRPSFWTRRIDFRRTFKKVGPFWLPERTESVTEVLLFGTSWVSISNGDYRVRLNTAGYAAGATQPQRPCLYAPPGN